MPPFWCLVQVLVTAWCHQATSRYQNQCETKSKSKKKTTCETKAKLVTQWRVTVTNSCRSLNSTYANGCAGLSSITIRCRMNSTFSNFVHIFVKSGLSITTTVHIETHIWGQDLKVTYTPGILEYFDKYSYYKTVDKNGHRKEMELDADPRPTDQWP